MTVKKGSERFVGDKLLELKPVKNVHMIYGEFDMIARVDVDNLLDLQKFITEKIRSIKEIGMTDTLIAAQ
ncbi:MAG TPA: Lrp/AsnC ligand binding domain-containing protein [Candidatus Nanoarchaeia archaeon]|nr:Lrp/AsnC ligand binding domain-containing protein [Candidatus Nanoarchaeia archaeon]